VVAQLDDGCHEFRAILVPPGGWPVGVQPASLIAPKNDTGGGVNGGGGGGGGDDGGIATWRMTLPPLHVASLLPAPQHEYGWSGASAAAPHVLPTL